VFWRWKSVHNLIDSTAAPVEKQEVIEATFGKGEGSCLERA
jgi:hypothetical protein